MNEDRTTRRGFTRLLLGLGLPLVAFAAGWVPYLALRSDLPDRLATHWGVGGTPDGSMTPTQFFGFTSLFMLAGSAVLVALAWRRTPLSSASVGAIGGFLGGFFAGLFAGILGGTVLSQRNLGVWTEADFPWLLTLGAIMFALVLGAAGARLGVVLPVEAEAGPSPADRPIMDLADDEHAVWTTRLHSPLLATMGIAVLGIGAIVAIGTVWWVIVPTLLSGLAALALATLNVRADRNGLHVRYGLLRWPRSHIPIADIESATVIDIRPMEWGGWGYRGSLKLMNRAAVVHRAGPGMRLDLRDGKVFAVTVDDPETPVALLNAEAARHHAPA